MAAVVSVDTAG